MTIIPTKHTLLIGAGVLAGVLIAPSIQDMVGAPYNPGFGLDDIVLGLTIATTVTLTMMIL